MKKVYDAIYLLVIENHHVVGICWNGLIGGFLRVPTAYDAKERTSKTILIK